MVGFHFMILAQSKSTPSYEVHAGDGNLLMALRVKPWSIIDNFGREKQVSNSAAS